MSGGLAGGLGAGGVAAMHRHGADRLVAEVNQGGDLVESGGPAGRSAGAVPRGARRTWEDRAGRTGGRALRAGPGASPSAGFDALEDQMCRMTVAGYEGQGSPDRVDALVWALTDLMVEPAAKWRRPQVRSL